MKITCFEWKISIYVHKFMYWSAFPLINVARGVHQHFLHILIQNYFLFAEFDDLDDDNISCKWTTTSFVIELTITYFLPRNDTFSRLLQKDNDNLILTTQWPSEMYYIKKQIRNTC